MASFTFLQLSDLHLGARFGWLESARRLERRREQQRALEDGVRAAIEHGARALLVPGDLFDREGVDAESIAFALHAFAVPSCPPVFIAPGNHDPLSDASPYWNPRLLRARGFAWPAHVHVFDAPVWSARALDGTPLVIWGRCFAGGIDAVERPLGPRALADRSAFDAASLHIGVFHGSREGVCPIGQTVTAPFSDADALGSPFHYLAVGHYHVRSQLDDANGARLAYAGSTVALDRAEVGSHGALVVRIDGSDGRWSVATEALELDPRRVHEVEVDVTEATGSDLVDRRILETLDATGVRNQDLVTVRLTGRLTRGVRYTTPGATVRERVFHLRLDLSRVRPDYDLERYRDPGTTTEDRFAHTLLERLMAEPDPVLRAEIESALYYGLDAFRLRDVAPAWEEIA